MNSGGVRGGLLYNQISGGEQPGEVTYAEAFTVQPFGNTLVVKTCTGQQIYDVLNQQFNNPSAGSNRIMLPSANVHYQWTTVGGPHIVDGTVSFDGGATPINKAAVLPRRREQLHGGRRRQLHGLPLVHRSRSGARSTSTRSRATSMRIRRWRRRR